SACAWPAGFAWFFAWRFAAGLAGGALIALAAPTCLPLVAPARHGLAGGAIFTGVGLGIAASGVLVPLLLSSGLVATWCALGLISGALTLAAWRAWPASLPVAPPASRPRTRSGRMLLRLYVEYGLNAAGLVPHMVFLVDFIARDLGRGLAAGASNWVLFGIGALFGPVLAGALADRIGFRNGLRLAFCLQAAAIAAP